MRVGYLLTGDFLVMSVRGFIKSVSESAMLVACGSCGLIRAIRKGLRATSDSYVRRPSGVIRRHCLTPGSAVQAALCLFSCVPLCI